MPYFPKTMVKNHKMIGNTSIMIMVGKVILLFHICSTVVNVVKFLGNHLLYLYHGLCGHVTRLLVLFEYDMTPLDIL